MKKIRIGIIGCGGMSRYHGKQFTTTTPDVEIVALVDTHQGNLDRYQQEVFDPVKRKPPQFHDHKEMLRKVEMDATLIVTPHTHHFEQVMDSFAAGCHVLVEKPMVTNTEHAKKVIAESKKRKKVLSIAFPGPFTREFQFIRTLVKEGSLGEIYLIDAVCTQYWLGAVQGTWRLDPKFSGGGQAYDSGSHMFNAMLYLSGLQAVEVFAWMDNKGQKVDIVTSATIKFNNGAFGTAAVSGDAPVMNQGVYLQGPKGAVKTWIYGDHLEYWDGKDHKVQYPVVPETTSLHQNFVDCIRGRAETPSPGELGLRQARLMDALYKSARSGRVVKVAHD
jgi:predicted dehydrogenase